MHKIEITPTGGTTVQKPKCYVITPSTGSPWARVCWGGGIDENVAWNCRACGPKTISQSRWYSVDSYPNRENRSENKYHSYHMKFENSNSNNNNNNNSNDDNDNEDDNTDCKLINQQLTKPIKNVCSRGQGRYSSAVS